MDLPATCALLIAGGADTIYSLEVVAPDGPRPEAARKEGLDMDRGFFNSPFLLGFEHLEKLLERTAKSAGDGYPPYNIEQQPGDSTERNGCLAITLAVAGFSKDDISITVEENQLVVRGRQNESVDKKFLHRGIAARQFLRSFVLAEGIEVTSAALENGLLKIDLERPKIQPGVRVVEIKTGGIS